jgi:hypothetical protein
VKIIVDGNDTETPDCCASPKLRESRAYKPRLQYNISIRCVNCKTELVLIETVYTPEDPQGEW